MTKKPNITSMIDKNHKKVNTIFLGIGLTLFVMNLTAFISFVKDMNYDFMMYNTAVFSSMIIVLITVYYLTEVYNK
jgi:hypothetical protein